MDSPVLKELNQRFGVPGVAEVTAGHGGLPRVVIACPACRGEIYLHGGHVTAWHPSGGQPVTYCSPNAHWHDGIAIRGGVPVCFPWFGDKSDNPSAPAHGFVRTKSWALESIAAVNDGVAVTMVTESDADTRKWWPHDFRLQCRATFGAALTLELIVTNTGVTEFTFEEALHAYFAVGDVQQAQLRCADARHYIDKTDAFREKPQDSDIHLVSETDRIYVSSTAEVVIEDPVWARRITLQKLNSRTTVIWNPWSEKSAAMADLGPGEWKNFVCVETSNVGAAAVSLQPGQTHIMTAHIQLS